MIQILKGHFIASYLLNKQSLASQTWSNLVNLDQTWQIAIGEFSEWRIWQMVNLAMGKLSKWQIWQMEKLAIGKLGNW